MRRSPVVTDTPARDTAGAPRDIRQVPVDDTGQVQGAPTAVMLQQVGHMCLSPPRASSQAPTAVQSQSQSQPDPVGMDLDGPATAYTAPPPAADMIPPASLSSTDDEMNSPVPSQPVPMTVDGGSTASSTADTCARQ